MGVLNKIKHMVKMTDFFYSSEMLRYENQLQYRTLTGGILSMGIIITIIIGFANMIGDTLNLSSITTQKEVIKQIDPTPSFLSTSADSHFMFGIQIWRINITEQKRYFDITFKLSQQKGGQVTNSVQYPLQRCTREHWAKLPSVLQNFDALQISGWLCPQIDNEFLLQGKYTSSFYNQFIIQVSACNNQTNVDKPCASQQQIDALFAQTQSFFYFTFYYINPVINSDQKEYKSYYLEDSSYVIFGDQVGSQTFIYFTDYLVTTDQSIWPFQQIQNDKGLMVENLAVNHPFQTNKQGVFVTINLVKSSNSIVYNRQVQKVSSVLSFMGGMIGAISALLFVIKMYTSLSFEISIALQVFKPEANSEIKDDSISMNFWTFLKFQLFQLSKAVGRQLAWPLMGYVDECQQEILRQLDIKALIKRLIFVEHCLTYIFQDYQLDGLQLKKPTSAKQIRKIREKCQSVFQGEGDWNSDQQCSSPLQSDVIEDIQKMKQPTIYSCSPTLINLNSYSHNQSSLKFPKTDKFISSRRYGFILKQNIIKDQPFQGDFESPVIDRIIQKRNTNQVKCNFKQKKARQSNLQILCNNAMEGNALSKKIWQNLKDSIPAGDTTSIISK